METIQIETVITYLSEKTGIKHELKTMPNEIERVIVETGTLASEKELKTFYDDYEGYDILTIEGEPVLSTNQGVKVVIFDEDVTADGVYSVEGIRNGTLTIFGDETPTEELITALQEIESRN